jgi:hypothetical protein
MESKVTKMDTTASASGAEKKNIDRQGMSAHERKHMQKDESRKQTKGA